MLTMLLMRLKRWRDEELPDFYLYLLACCQSVNGVFRQRERSYSTLSVMRVLSFMVAVRANALVGGDDMWDCRTVSNASRASFSLT